MPGAIERMAIRDRDRAYVLTVQKTGPDKTIIVPSSGKPACHNPPPDKRGHECTGLAADAGGCLRAVDYSATI
jgi:hypothetical protein